MEVPKPKSAVRYGWLALMLFAVPFFEACKTTESTSTAEMINHQWSVVKTADGSKPVKRHEAGFVEIDNVFYLLGGRGIRPVSIYDSQKNEWKEGAEPPIELHHFQPVVYKGEIIVAGAMTGGYPGETPVANFYVYNPVRDEWREGPQIPEPRRRGGAGAVVKGDLLYLVCGIRDGHRGDHKDFLDEYNFKTDEWKVLPKAPRPRDHFQAVIIENKIYVAGGRTTVAADNPFKNTIGDVDVYHLERQEWHSLERPLPTLRAGNSAYAIGPYLVILGGESDTQEKAHSEVEALDSRSGEWKSWIPLSRGRHGTGAVYSNGFIYTASGCGNRGGNPELEDLLRSPVNSVRL